LVNQAKYISVDLPSSQFNFEANRSRGSWVKIEHTLKHTNMDGFTWNFSSKSQHTQLFNKSYHYRVWPSWDIEKEIN